MYNKIKNAYIENGVEFILSDDFNKKLNPIKTIDQVGIGDVVFLKKWWTRNDDPKIK